MKKHFLGATALFVTLGVSAPAMAEFDLTILHTNDIHSRIEPITKYDSGCKEEDNEAGKCFGGIARVATAIKERRAAHENTILLDAGDQFQGSLFYSYYKGQAAAEFVNALGYDAMAVGNHEFDDGPDALRKFIDATDLPVLLANAEASKDEFLADQLISTTIIEVAGEKVGVIGVLAEDTDETSSPGENVKLTSTVESAKAEVAKLEAEGINKIILLSHVGISQDKVLAAEVSGVDVIVGGHSHTLLSNTQKRAKGPYPTWIDGPEGKPTPIVQAYAYGKFLGELKVKFDDDGNLLEAVGEPILLDASVAEDAAIKARVKELAVPLDEIRNAVIGSTSEAIDGSRSTCRAQECQMGNLIADAIFAATKDQGIEIVIQNGGGLRASIDAGDVTMGEVLTVLPFKNTLATFEMEGKYIKEALENGLSKLEEGAGRFPQVGGLKYSFDASKPAGERVVELTLKDGTAVEADKVYKVATNDYMRGGGDGYKIFAEKGMNAYDFGPGLEVVVADYLKAKGGAYTPYLDGRITDVTAK